MPKQTNGVRSGPRRNRDAPSDENNDQESRSPNSADISHSSTEESRNSAAALASCNKAVQSLAGITSYFSSYFLNDIKTIERTFEPEIEMMAEIQRLNETIEKLTYVKNAELENFRRENEGLRAGQEACEQERKRCQVLQAELETRQIEAEARFKDKYEAKLKDERIKAQKRLEARMAEVETGSRKKIQDLEDLTMNKVAENERLKDRLSEANDKLEAKKLKYARLQKSLEDENRILSQDMRQLKSEFHVDGHDIQFYKDEFRQIADNVNAISSRYFLNLPEHAVANPEASHQGLSKLHAILNPAGIWRTEVSDFLRTSGIRHAISTQLYSFIWQPFFPQDDQQDHHVMDRLLEEISRSLSGRGGRIESVWRVLTLQGIESSGEESSLLQSIVRQVLDVVGPLVNPFELASFEKDIVDLIERSFALWQTARKDIARVFVYRQPDLRDQESWQAEDIEVSGEASSAKVDISDMKPLCLFPSIFQITPQGEAALVQHGSALFPTSRVWIEALSEKKEHEEERAKAVLEVESKYRARRTSYPTGPNSPLRNKSAVKT